MSSLEAKNNLFLIPIELRNPIYDEVLASGHTAILRTNSAIYAETKDRVYKQRVLCLFIGRSDGFYLPVQAEKVQKLHLTYRIDDKVMANSTTKTWLKEFQDTTTTRESLEVTIVGMTYHLPFWILSPLSCELKTLNGFRKIVVRIKAEQEKGGGVRLSQSYLERIWAPRTVPMHLGADIASLYACVLVGLGDSFGNADFDDTEGGHALTYHPYAA